MDISSGCDKLECQDVSSFGGLQSSLKKKQTRDCDFDHDVDHLVSELENALDENLHIKDCEQFEQVSCDEDDVGNKKERYESERPNVEEEPKASRKSLNKCASFPCPEVMQQTVTLSEKDDEEPEIALKGLLSEEAHRNAYTRSISLPAPSKLVSAMKGSREKNGASPRKLSVSWAPDVYDPMPTSVSHSVRGGKKQQKSRNNKKNWKNGKKGQKGNTSRGGSGKDKKQSRKVSGNPNGSYKSVDVPERLTELNDEFGDFAVCSPDSQSFCGTSFLKKSLTKMHYSVAEAL